MAWTDSDIAQALRVAARLERLRGSPFRAYFPDTGPLRRELYPRSLQFFAAGAVHRERLFLGANRVSKTVTAAFEVTAHATGQYPAWWEGRRFPGATKWWVAGDSRETTRDIVQRELFGARDDVRGGRWSGMVPAECIVDRTLKPGVSDCLDTVWIRHVERHHGAPLVSTIGTKSYDQGREAFQGTSQDGCWLDEEPPAGSADVGQGGTPSGAGDIYTECLLRTATTDGLILLTMTPLRGLTAFLEQYLETAEMADADGHTVNAKRGMFGA